MVIGALRVAALTWVFELINFVISNRGVCVVRVCACVCVRVRVSVRV